MNTFNFAGEYSMLIILFVAFFSFYNNYKENTSLNIILKINYLLTFLTIVFAVFRGMINAIEATTFIQIFVSYIINTIYYILIPSFSFCYLAFTTIITANTLDFNIITKKFKPLYILSAIYFINLFYGILEQKIFYIGENGMFVEGNWYNISYIYASIAILVNVIQIFDKRKNINKKNSYAILLTLIFTSIALILRSLYPETISTALMSNMNILAIHMFLINRQKSVNKLTGTNNFIALRYNMNSFIEKNEDFSLYIISLREFKTINQRNGFAFGDKVLKNISKKMFEFFEYEEIYRYRGDEFGILLKKNSTKHLLVEKFLNEIKKPMNIENIETVNLNVICVRVDSKTFGSTVDELISSIEYSISILKEPHCEKDYLYDKAIVKDIIKKSRMIQKIKHAIDNRMFQMCYQPMYSAKDKKFTQAEALVRMKDGKGGMIFPSEFIDIAEVTDLIIPMTYVILDIVCEDFRRLLDKYGDDLLLEAISVNFPYNIFLKNNMQDKVEETLKKYNLSPKHIKIEITERTLIAENNMLTETMNNMLDTGFTFELDDFGVDYSNVSTFLDLPLNIIKIDRSVLLSAMLSESNKSFFRHLTSGISATGRIIIVEGIEEKSQLDFVLSSNCQYVQGYIFSKPLLFNAFSIFIGEEAQEELLNSIMK